MYLIKSNEADTAADDWSNDGKRNMVMMAGSGLNSAQRTGKT
jgi:hypothetical protein